MNLSQFKPFKQYSFYGDSICNQIFENVTASWNETLLYITIQPQLWQYLLYLYDFVYTSLIMTLLKSKHVAGTSVMIIFYCSAIYWIKSCTINLLHGIWITLKKGKKLPLSTQPRPALRSAHSPTQWLFPGMGIRRPGLEADHSPTSGAEIKNEWSHTPTPDMPSWPTQ